jgi:hypothetical protein
MVGVLTIQTLVEKIVTHQNLVETIEKGSNALVESIHSINFMNLEIGEKWEKTSTQNSLKAIGVLPTP